MLKRMAKLLVTAIVAAALILLFWNQFLKPQLELQLYPISFGEIVEANAAEFGVPREIIFAVIRTESSFEKNAVSRSGAKGLMQLMDETNAWIAEMCGEEAMTERIFEPELNIRRGVWLLAHLKRQFGDWEVALAAYNAGYGRVQKWLADPEYSIDGETLDFIPFDETREYVKRVLAAAEKYREIYY